MTALVGRYMKNNATGQIVPIIAQRFDRYGEAVAYQSRTRKSWVHTVRIVGADPNAADRLNGYTLLPADYRPEGLDVT